MGDFKKFETTKGKKYYYYRLINIFSYEICVLCSSIISEKDKSFMISKNDYLKKSSTKICWIMIKDMKVTIQIRGDVVAVICK